MTALSETVLVLFSMVLNYSSGLGTEWDCTGTIQHCLERDNRDNGFARRIPPPTTLFLHVRVLVLTRVYAAFWLFF